MNLIGIIRSILQKRKYHLSKLGRNVVISKVIFEGFNSVFSNTTLMNCVVGKFSYVSNNCRLANTKIGRYCSIANDVCTCNGQHPTSIFVTTYPSFYYNTEKQIGFSFHKDAPLFNTSKYADASSEFEVIIGNDVWIGSHVLLMPGIKIGDGAIVAAGSVVTKDVEPYNIVGGSPAKLIKKRFNDNQINRLLKIEWWNKPHDSIIANYRLFENIDSFLSNYV